MPYFDAASTAPLHPLARQALLSALDEGWADPARLYRDARRARMMLDAARETVAAELGARPDEVVFTASGTQANQLGVLGALAGNHRKGLRLVHSAVEHSSVLHAAEQHQARGGNVAAVPVDRLGRVDPERFAQELLPGTALACLQAANHEVGTVQPVAEVGERCARAGVPLLVDAAQSAGRLDVPGGWSLLTASAHKWGGPAGVGVLAVRKGVRYRSPLPADDRESGRVPGFVNVPGAIAAAVALRAVRQEAARLNPLQHARIDRLRAELPGLVPDLAVLGDPERRLPHLLTFSCLYVDGEALLGELDRAGFAVSSGSSCTSSTLTPSHVLAAMGVLTEGNIRVSLPPDCTDADVELFLSVLPRAVAAVRSQLEPPAAGAGAARAGSAAAADGAEDGGGALVLDTLGRRCPIPVIELAKHFAGVPVGGLVAVLSDDEAARLDIPAWCEMRGQRYEGETPSDAYGPGGGSAYLVRRLS
ncbi:aminotransferase class V-fold PLP-dependent enzyme [Streptacidiphilus sp. PB12-B1b]|uniref:cysteine desulfurase/sulfurtransferase TusA family protein n=1 Tax=Streptacidiphilus sp. PB12-B1b TaxID=2705012 RepID=UPI0015FBBE9A|nr:cysteine desulfurase/sulfurtransferase TusA family protein [Streptacidiphilus sp. PB12-B1b]QMU75854.1 aminotransferase class V-fold PLP-dependent enzyme [Streptacidiphilus sp. PB12-B1b]